MEQGCLNREIMGGNYRLHFNDMAVVPGKNLGYASSMEFNGLFEVRLDTWECTYIADFPNEKKFQKDTHFSAVYCEGRVFFFPQRGTYISIYTPEEGTFSQIELRACGYPHYYGHIKIGQAFSHGKKVYAVGASYPYVVVIDGGTLEAAYIPMDVGKRAIMFRAGGCFAGEKFFIPSTVSGLILSIDLTDDAVRLHSPEPAYKGAWAMAYDGEKFWIAPFWERDAVRAWDPEDGRVVAYADFPKGYRSGGNPFLRCFFVNGRIWLWPWTANMILSVDPMDGRMREESCGMDFSDEAMTGCLFVKNSSLCLKRKAKREDAWYAQEGEVCTFDLKEWKLEKRAFVFSGGRNDFLRSLSALAVGRLRNGVGESDEFSLEEYVALLQAGGQEMSGSVDDAGENVGSRIYGLLVKDWNGR